MSMSEHDAESFTNQVIGKLIEHQPQVFGTNPLYSASAAKEAAQNLAAFRKELIVQLQQK
jgi:hypothetical protein